MLGDGCPYKKNIRRAPQPSAISTWLRNFAARALDTEWQVHAHALVNRLPKNDRKKKRNMVAKSTTIKNVTKENRLKTYDKN